MQPWCSFHEFSWNSFHAHFCRRQWEEENEFSFHAHIHNDIRKKPTKSPWSHPTNPHYYIKDFHSQEVVQWRGQDLLSNFRSLDLFSSASRRLCSLPFKSTQNTDSAPNTEFPHWNQGEENCIWSSKVNELKLVGMIVRTMNNPSFTISLP